MTDDADIGIIGCRSSCTDSAFLHRDFLIQQCQGFSLPAFQLHLQLSTSTIIFLPQLDLSIYLFLDSLPFPEVNYGDGYQIPILLLCFLYAPSTTLHQPSVPKAF